MKIKLTLIFLISNLLSFSQINFEDKTTLIDDTHITNDINSIAIADLDNDNWRDLIITSYDDKIMWYKNVNGDFRHFQRNILSINQIDIPKYITVADLNNDGLLDLIVVNDSSIDNIFWFENLGNGDFSSEILISDSINGASSIETIDIDNDGDIDILTGGATKTVILIENNNDETFQNPQVIYDGGSFTRQVKSKDLNNDGLSDIISSHSNGTIYWSENLGNNVFGNREYITGSSDNGSALDFIDANEDGYLDIVTANSYSSDNVRYILNQNGNTFDNNNPIIIDNSIQDPYRLGVKDIDNDGKDDIVVSFWTNDNVSWYRNLGSGNFSTANLISDTLNNSKSIAIEDIDNDGLNDIVSSSNPSSEQKLSLFKNENNGTYFDETIIHHSYGYPKDIKSSDLDNDGNNDIIIACDDLIWFKNYGSSNFSSYKLISADNNHNYFDSVISDLDSDGIKEIIGLRSDGGIEVFISNEDDSYASMYYSYGNLSGNMLLEDIDGDGYKDIIARIDDSSDNKIAWIKNNGDLSFGNMNIFTANTSSFKANKITAGDIDNDGDIDVVVSSRTTSKIYLLENDGLGNFSNSLVMQSITTNPISLEDVDNDGYLDIVSGGYYIGNKKVYWIKNNAGVFSSSVNTIDNNVGITEFSFEDIDNNGYKDLMCVHYESASEGGDEKVFYYLNNGGVFGSMVLVDNVGHLLSLDRDIILEDINNDNKLDIITSYLLTRKADYYVNTSTLSIIDNSNSDLANFIVFPVPFSNKLRWKFLHKKTNILEIKVYDSLGKIHFSNNSILNDEIDLTSLSKGIYFIKFTTSDDIKITRKIIKD